jgi:hypothetical protein
MFHLLYSLKPFAKRKAPTHLATLILDRKSTSGVNLLQINGAIKRLTTVEHRHLHGML